MPVAFRERTEGVSVSRPSFEEQAVSDCSYATRRRTARKSTSVAVAVVVAVLTCGAVAWAVHLPEAPFAAEQCGPALDYARKRLEADPNDARASGILAEALLCFGAQGDVRALEQAVRRLGAIVDSNPDDFFAHLYFADALRRRYLLSDEAVDAARSARELLGSNEVGNSRRWLTRYLDEWISRLEEQRVQFARPLREGEARYRQGTSTPLEVGDWLVLLATTGPDAARRAVQILDAYAARSGDSVLTSFYRAELLRAVLPDEELMRLYEEAERVLCAGPTEMPRAQRCATAQARLRRLQAADDGRD